MIIGLNGFISEYFNLKTVDFELHLFNDTLNLHYSNVKDKEGGSKQIER